MSGNRMAVAAALLSVWLLAGGCMVTSSKYEMKTKEADTLRDAIAGLNKDRAVLEARTEALSRQISEGKRTEEQLSARVRTLEEENRRQGEELSSAKQNYEGTRITREQFISELLDKEKATGKRIQELGARALTCEQALETLRKESAVRDNELAELRRNLEKPGDGEALKRERDILLGRVERLTEERGHEIRRRENRYAALAEALAKVSQDIALDPLGPALRVYLPEKVLFPKGKTSLSSGGKAAVSEVGKAAADFPSSSVVLSAGGKKAAEEIKAVLVGEAKLSQDRIATKNYEKEKGAELLLIIP